MYSLKVENITEADALDMIKKEIAEAMEDNSGE
jgi:hypothetical protein